MSKADIFEQSYNVSDSTTKELFDPSRKKYLSLGKCLRSKGAVLLVEICKVSTFGKVISGGMLKSLSLTKFAHSWLPQFEGILEQHRTLRGPPWRSSKEMPEANKRVVNMGQSIVMPSCDFWCEPMISCCTRG